ncbi:hypothetical protein [Burkholderia ubonensis]|uniref:hypothetical protein n=1 Tax=Burkholderia ubonensis TaxID=101571 RepID=UPI0012FC2125|nr:hypothetical protein [Burkholderia ubonensis]
MEAFAGGLRKIEAALNGGQLRARFVESIAFIRKGVLFQTQSRSCIDQAHATEHEET